MIVYIYIDILVNWWVSWDFNIHDSRPFFKTQAARRALVLARQARDVPRKDQKGRCRGP